MYPENLSCDSAGCLEALVGVRSSCKQEDCAPMYIEDIPGYDIKKLSKLAGPSDLSGDALARRIIKSATKEMLGDIQLMINDGYGLKFIQEDVCSVGEMNAMYTVTGGVSVKNMYAQRFGTLRISQVTVLANVTGSKIFIIDDSVTQQEFTVDLTAGVAQPVIIDYSTSKSRVKIYFQDPTVGAGRIAYSTTTGCGCGSGRKSTTGNSPIVMSGLLNQLDSTNQYGFLVCASVTCSSDAMVCALSKQLENMVALTLFYKVAELVNRFSRKSERNNNEAGFGDEDKRTDEDTYRIYYWARMKGSKDTHGLRHAISQYIKLNKDACVVCESTGRSIGFGTG